MLLLYHLKGRTFAHSDVAMEFASWISAEFELYIIKGYQRLKSDENSKLSLSWNLNREISKINYKIHTDAIKTYLLENLTKEQLSYKYASEADMLNVALFNKRAKEWRKEIPFFNDRLKEILSFSGTSVLVNEAFCFFLSIFLMTKISKLSTEQLGFTKNNIVSSYLKGSLFGILEILSVFIIIFGLKAIDVYFIGNITILTLIKIFTIFFFQGLLEEILFRGYLMPMFSKVIGIKFSIILLSFLFTCIHLINPNLDIIGLANVFLAGVIFSLIHYYTGNLWIVGAMHTFWNFILGYVVGSQISGIVIYKLVFFSIPVENRDLISGGAFGFEASIITTIVELAISHL